MMNDYKIILGILAALLSFAAHIPYIITLLRGANRPHIFTWVIWTLLTAIACAAQFTGNAGPGAWSTLVTVFLCIVITVLTFRQGDKNITRSDWVMFVLGLGAIPLWLLTNDPLGAVILVTIVDALAFGPTIRKSWNAPHNENTTMYGVNIVRHVIALAAISQYSLVTALYVAMLLVMNAATLGVLLLRRHAYGRQR